MQNKLLRKIFILSLSMLIILTIYTIPTLSNNNVLRTNLEIEDITHEGETTLSVQSGDVYNSNGESVETFVINYDKQAGLTIDDEYVRLYVSDNQYR